MATMRQSKALYDAIRKQSQEVYDPATYKPPKKAAYSGPAKRAGYAGGSWGTAGGGSTSTKKSTTKKTISKTSGGSKSSITTAGYKPSGSKPRWSLAKLEMQVKKRKLLTELKEARRKAKYGDRKKPEAAKEKEKKKQTWQERVARVTALKAGKL